MIRQIIKIDEEKCNGCGLCASACHEGAIQMIGGKAKLIRDDYCDGLETAFQCVRPAPSPLKTGRPRTTTKRQFLKTRERII